MRIGFVVIGALLTVGCKKTPPPAPVVLPAQQAPVIDPDGVVDALTPPAQFHPDLRPPVKADTMNGDPGGPKQADFDAVQADGQRKVQACFDAIPAATVLPNNSAHVAVKFEVGNDGKAHADITTDLPAESAGCPKAAMEGLTFPAFTGPPVRNSFSMAYNRPAPAAAPAAAPAPK